MIQILKFVDPQNSIIHIF